MQLPTIKTIIEKNIKKDQYAKYLELFPNLQNGTAQKYTTIILSLVASIILGIFAITPTISTIAGLQRTIQDDIFVEQKLQDKINSLSVLQQKYSLIKNDLTVIFSAVPQQSEIPTLLAQLQGISKISGLNLISFQTFPITLAKDALQNKKYSSFDFNLKTQGDYLSLSKFIDLLASFQRVISLTSIAISKSSDNNNLLQLSIKGTVYFKN